MVKDLSAVHQVKLEKSVEQRRVDSMGKTYCNRHRKSEGKPEAPEAFYKLRDGKRIAKAKLAALATETGNATTVANED